MVSPRTAFSLSRLTNLTDVRTEVLDRARSGTIEYHPSPRNSFQNEILYFLLPDRFSDAGESGRPLLSRNEIREMRQQTTPFSINWQQWAESGKRWQGGTIKGIESKLDYLKDLGVSTLWVGPMFKQRSRLNTYHGYGIQDFLEIDPRFGTREDLQALVEAVHARDMYIILDIIMNHSGDNWGYVKQGNPPRQIEGVPYLGFPGFYGDVNHPYQIAWRNSQNEGFTFDGNELANPDDGVWPTELQDEERYTRAGFNDDSLGQGDIRKPYAEHKRTDFFDLKDFALDVGETLNFLSDIFKYWIAITDCDGFRLDTVKHISIEETRAFCGSIKEFASKIGKGDFFLVGEIAGGDYFQDVYGDELFMIENNLDATLDIGVSRTEITNVGKGLTPASDYLNNFEQSSQGFEFHRNFGDRHVSILDDHDHVIGTKIRFSAEIPDNSPVKDHQIVAATAFQLFTLGIPCIYYGSEQAFSGPPQSQIQFLEAQGWITGSFNDRYLRETMFGPNHPLINVEDSSNFGLPINTRDTSIPGFGAFGTSGKHCFDTQSPAYVRIAALCKARSENIVFIEGRQFARQIRLPGTGFNNFPSSGELVAWSRLLDTQEGICIVNPNGSEFRGGDIVVAAELLSFGTEFRVIVNTAEVAANSQGETFTGSHPIGSTVEIITSSGGPAFIQIRDIPPAEVLILIK
ncbi:MAG: alpha-amylase family glycosyl hydrolase [Microcystaceae cyanobacterium]